MKTNFMSSHIQWGGALCTITTQHRGKYTQRHENSLRLPSIRPDRPKRERLGERVIEASKEIKTGVRISLDWPLSMPSYPSFNHDPFKQQIVLRHPNCVYDDKSWQFYNGHTRKEIEGSDVIGIHSVCEHGGITGRGVLLDYADWAATNSISVSTLKSETISLKHLQQAVKDHKLAFQKGDECKERSVMSI
ncbi:hypothetical protein N7457_007502 [Penicillium paradoxum]|uniref:uncharacterized protein n=1 Tax=Penicillium paradoxum TaxID=176176 RepID=UPI002549112C|nr:uncharacterized protein N7457_007502 [Penicillium paradoxum]KAJ5779782.1 hypothetical protein N7457_007502 [Penicillium paradoxum]